MSHLSHPSRPHQIRPLVADLGVFDGIEQAFGLCLTGPSPLALDGETLGEGMPGRLIVLDELRELLLSGRVHLDAQDAAWRQVIGNCRTDGPARASWRLGALGLALPGLRAEAGRLAHEHGGPDPDVDQDLVTAFLDAVERIDPDRRHLVSKLMDAVKQVGVKLRYQDSPPLPIDREDERCLGLPPRLPWRHAEMVLIDAIAKNVLSGREAEIIARTRIEHVLMPELAREYGEPVFNLYRCRQRAEDRLVRAITSGQVRASLTPPAA